MSKTFNTIKEMKQFFYDNGISIAFTDLIYAIKTGNLFVDNFDFECYYDDTENLYVLEW